MRYTLLFCNDLDAGKRWEALPEETRNEIYGRIGKWFEDNGSVMRGGEELQGAATATTVRFNGNQQPIVTDGPFVEASEVVGGFSVIEVENLDAALKLAKTWPGMTSVEVRPVVDHSAG